MTDDVAVVHEALRARGWRSVASALGIQWRGERISCPIHGGDGANFDLDEHDGRLTWICSSHCGTGDVFELIQRLSGCDFKAALREAADIAGVILDDGSERSEEEREAMRRQREAYAEAANNRPPDRPKPRPDPRQSATMWDAAQRVTTDREIADYMASRALDPERISFLDLARVVRVGAPMPSWATYKGRPWLETGHRLIMQTFAADGGFVGLRAWRVGGDEETPKRLPQAGFSARGLVLANRQATEMLRDGYPGRLVVCEGEPDFCSHAIRDRYPVVGITSGSWSQELADRIAIGSEVIILTHVDDAGAKYAEHVVKTLRSRVAVWRGGVKGADENDRAITRKLPNDPRADAKLINDVATTRVVADMLRGAALRAVQGKRSKQCTTGIRVLDEAAGGIHDGWSWLIGAETNWGKSLLATHIIGENLDQENPRVEPDWEVILVSFEDPEELYADRLLCWRAKVRADHLRAGTCTPDELKRIDDVIKHAERKPLFVDARDHSAEWAAGQVKRILAVRKKVRLVLYDYLQEARSEQRGLERRIEIGNVAKTLRAPVKAENRASIIFSQINEETGPNGWPTKESISESRDPGKGADVIALGFTPKKDVKDDKGLVKLREGTRYIYVDKVKQGRKGFVTQLCWNDDAACFERTGYGEDDRYDRMAREQRGPAPSIDAAAEDCSDLDDYIDNRAGPGQWD